MPRRRYHETLNRRDPVTKERIPTRTEEKVLAILVNPEHFRKTNAQKIALATCSCYQFYKIMRNPWFQKQVKDAALQLLHGQVMGVFDAAIETAKEVGRDGFNDRKMLLEMAGYYNPTATVTMQHTGADGGPIEVEHRHEFNSKRFQDLYLRRTGRTGGIETSARIIESNGNRESVHPVQQTTTRSPSRILDSSDS